MRVSVEGGKYTYVITETNAHVLRYGKLWKDATGDKFTYCMAAEIESLREQVEKLTKERDSSRKWAGAQAKLINKQEQQLAALAEQNKQLKAELKSIDGALNDPRANLTLTTSEIIWELKEQVEKLTEAYDQCGRTVQDYGRTIDQTESRLREVVTHCANVEEKLAAIAEQNAKMRKALIKWRYLDSSYNWRCGHCGNEEGDEHKEGCALSLPDLATSILNKEEGEMK